MVSRQESKKLLASIVKKAERSELASIGSVVAKIMEIIRNPDSNAVDLKDTIEVDPPLSAKVLRRANSAQYSLRRVITSIQESIVLLGFNTVRELALNLKVSDIFQDTTDIFGYSRKQLWKHSVATAMIAKNICRREFSEKGDEMYSAGLLHDIGMIVFDQYEHELFLAIAEIAQTEHRSYREVEKEMAGFDHARIARELTRSWKLPELLVQPIANHEEPERCDIIYRKQAMTIFVADYLAQSCKIGFVNEADLSEERFEKCVNELKLNAIGLEIIAEDVQSEIAKLEEIGEL